MKKEKNDAQKEKKENKRPEIKKTMKKEKKMKI